MMTNKFTDVNSVSEEKMQNDQAFLAAVFSLKEVKRGDESDGDFLMRLYYHIWQAALQESEAGAVDAQNIPLNAIGRMLSEVMETAISNGANSVSMPDHYVEVAAWLSNVEPSAPPSAQAIETAAIMRAAATVACPGRTIFDTEKAILALIPQDGRTALEKFGMKVATETRSAVLINTREDLFTEDSSLRAIVTNLIGAAK